MMLKSVRSTFPSPFSFAFSVALKTAESGRLYQYAAIEKSTRLTLQLLFKSAFPGHFAGGAAVTLLVPTRKLAVLLKELISPSTAAFDFARCCPMSRTDVSKL